MTDTTEPQPQEEYRFEVAILFGTEPFRNPTLLPDVLNPWRYLAKRRVQKMSANTVHEKWDDWSLNAEETVPGEFTPYVTRGRKTDSEYVYEQVCKVEVSASDSDAARTRIEDGLSTMFENYTIRPFESQRFASQIGRAEGIV